MLKIERFSKQIIGFVLLFSLVLTIGSLFSCSGTVQGITKKSLSASDKKNERALLEWKARLEKDNKLYAYAIKLFKTPIRREAIIDKNTDYPHDYYCFIFSGGNEFRVETLLPEITIFRLKTLKGFPDDKEVIKVLKQCARDYGLDLNWQKTVPQESLNDDERTIQYEAIEEGDNSAVTLVYKKGKLVEVGFHCNL